MRLGKNVPPWNLEPQSNSALHTHFIPPSSEPAESLFGVTGFAGANPATVGRTGRRTVAEPRTLWGKLETPINL